MTLADLHRVLTDYATLRDGWDGPGSLAPHPWSQAAATAFLTEWPEGWPLPQPMIANTGHLGFYWPDQPPAFMDLEFDDEGTASLYGRWLTDDQGEFHDAVPLADLKARMAPLMAHYFRVETPDGGVTGGG